MLNAKFSNTEQDNILSIVALTSYVSKKQPWPGSVDGDQLPWHMHGSVATGDLSVI